MGHRVGHRRDGILSLTNELLTKMMKQLEINTLGNLEKDVVS